MKISNNIQDGMISYASVAETPSGSKNGSNKVFTLSRIPVISCQIFVIDTNGVQSQPTFTISKLTATFDTYAPASTDTLWAIFV